MLFSYFQPNFVENERFHKILSSGLKLGNNGVYEREKCKFFIIYLGIRKSLDFEKLKVLTIGSPLTTSIYSVLWMQ